MESSYDRSSLSAMKYRDLQSIAKQVGLKANLKAAELVDNLDSFFQQNKSPLRGQDKENISANNVSSTPIVAKKIDDRGSRTAAPFTPADIEKLNYASLRSLAKSVGLNAKGKAVEIKNSLNSYLENINNPNQDSSPQEQSDDEKEHEDNQETEITKKDDNKIDHQEDNNTVPICDFGLVANSNENEEFTDLIDINPSNDDHVEVNNAQGIIQHNRDENDDNIIVADDNIIDTDDNIIDTDDNIIDTDDNIIDTDDNIVADDNIIDTDDNIIDTDGNKINNSVDINVANNDIVDTFNEIDMKNLENDNHMEETIFVEKENNTITQSKQESFDIDEEADPQETVYPEELIETNQFKNESDEERSEVLFKCEESLYSNENVQSTNVQDNDLDDKLNDLVQGIKYLAFTDKGRVKFTLTGHEIRADYKDVEQFINSKKVQQKICLAEYDFYQYDYIVEHPELLNYLYCQLTDTSIPKEIPAIERFVQGKKYLEALQNKKDELSKLGGVSSDGKKIKFNTPHKNSTKSFDCSKINWSLGDNDDETKKLSSSCIRSKILFFSSPDK